MVVARDRLQVQEHPRDVRVTRDFGQQPLVHGHIVNLGLSLLLGNADEIRRQRDLAKIRVLWDRHTIATKQHLQHAHMPCLCRTNRSVRLKRTELLEHRRVRCERLVFTRWTAEGFEYR